MKRTNRLIAFCLSMWCSTVLLMGQAGSSAFSFMGLPMSARLSALGGSNIATRDGELSFALCNPALLSEETHMVLNLNYANYMLSSNFASVLYGHNYGANRFAAAIHYLDYGRIQYADEMGNRNGRTFSAQDILFQVSYARELGHGFSVGASLKPVVSAYEAYTSFALGADAGAHYQTRDSSFHIGLSLQNIGWQLKTFYAGGRREMLPLNLQLGLSYRFRHAPIRLGMTVHNMQRWNLSYQTTNQPRSVTMLDETDKETGVKWYDMLFRHTIFSVEIVPKNDRFWLAVSYNHRMRQEMQMSDVRSIAGMAVGAGLRIKQFRLGYAFTMYQKGAYVHQVSLSMNIKELMK